MAQALAGAGPQSQGPLKGLLWRSLGSTAIPAKPSPRSVPEGPLQALSTSPHREAERPQEESPGDQLCPSRPRGRALPAVLCWEAPLQKMPLAAAPGLFLHLLRTQPCILPNVVFPATTQLPRIKGEGCSGCPFQDDCPLEGCRRSSVERICPVGRPQ